MIFSAKTVEEMHTVGQKIAEQCKIPSIVYLQGDLGAGKTTLVQGISQFFDYKGVVSSPTYNLIHEYPTSNVAIAHLDLYRLNDAEELEMLGLSDLLHESSLLLIEWPEKGGDRLPKADYMIDIQRSDANNADAGRTIEFTDLANG